jgi:hypothetical protein
MNFTHRLTQTVATIALFLALPAWAVTLSGSIRNTQGTPICGLVLANGAFVFSCSPVGSYFLSDVPLDANGQITLYGFAEGHFPFKAILGSGGTRDITLSIASSSPPADDNRTRTERLIGGTWSLTYVILSSFTDRYTFTTIQASTASPGDYNALGTGQFGDPVIGTYASSTNAWGILDPGTIIDRFFVFNFNDNNRVTGCYFQINPPGSTNLSNCYAMTGSRSPLKDLGSASTRDTRLQEALETLEVQAEQGTLPVPDPAVLDLYIRTRRHLDEQKRR